MSQLLQCYEYLIALPSIYISLSNYQHVLSIINAILTVFIGSLLISLDYDYKFCNSDVLQKCDSHLNPTMFHLDLTLSIASCFFDIYILTGVFFVINMLKLFIILKTHCYLNREICRWSINFSLFRATLILPMIVYCTRDDEQQSLLFLSCLVIFPISYKLGNYIFVSWYNYINLEIIQNNQQIQSFSIFRYILDDENKKTDIFCRLLFHSIQEKTKFVSAIQDSAFVFASHQILQGEQQQQLESQEIQANTGFFGSTKKENIKLINQIKQIYDEKETVSEIFNENIMNTIIKIYKDNSDSKKFKNNLSDLHFSYLTFLSTLSLNSCMSYIQILNIKSNQKLRLGLKDLQKMQTIMNQAEIQAQLNNSRLKVKEQFQLQHILQFEEDMNKIQQSYFECMRQYRIVVEKLSMNYVDINEMLELLKQYRAERVLLEKIIIQQLKQNSLSETLKNLCINFDFYMLHKRSLLKFYENNNRIQSEQLKNKEYYSKSSCFIFVSLLEKNFGMVHKANRSFIKSFGFANKSQLVGKSIKQVLPDNFLKKQTENMASQIITENFLSLYNEIFNLPLFIAQNCQGYSIPCQLKFQSQIIDSQDFGVTIWAKPIKDDNLYVMLDYKDHSQIKVASKIFCQEFLYENFTLQNLKNVRMDSLIPIIDGLIKVSKIEQGKKFETILIQPYDKFEAQNKANLKDNNFLNSLKFAQLYMITLSIQCFDTKLASFVNVIIENYQCLYTYKDKVQYIQLFQNQIKEFCGVQLPFDSSYEEDMLSDYRVKSYQQNNDQYQKYNLEVVKSFQESEIRGNNQFNNENYLPIQNLYSSIDNSNAYQKQSSQIAKNISDQFQQQNQIQVKDSNQNSTNILISNQDQLNLLHSLKQNVIEVEQNKQQDYQNLKQNLSKQVNDSPESKNNEEVIYQEMSITQKKIEVSTPDFFEQNLKVDKLHQEEISNNYNQQHLFDDSKLPEQIFNISAAQDTNKNGQQYENLNSQDILFNSNLKSTLFKDNLDSREKDFQIQNSKEQSHNQLLSTKSAFQLTAFKRKQKTLAQNQTMQGEKEKDKSTIKESKVPITQEESQKRQNKDLQSVSSSTKSVQTQYLFEMIHAKKQMSYLKIINAIGIISVLVTLSLTFSGFFTFLTSLISQRENFKYINWIYLINIQMSYALSEHYIYELNQNGLLKTPSSSFQAFNQLLKTQYQSRINLTKDFIAVQYNTTSTDIQVFKIIQSKLISQNIYYNKQRYDQYNLSFTYSLLLQSAGIYYLASNQDPTRLFEQQNEQNYPNLNNQVQSVIQSLNSQYQNQFDSIQNQSLIQLYVVLLVTFIFLCSIIPSYIFAKLRQQKILELFATFDPQSLKEILGQLTYQLSFYQGFDKNQTIGSRSNYSNMNQTHISRQAQAQVIIEKKLNISRTSSLQYSIKFLAIGLITIFCLIMIYPVVNYIIIKIFIDNSTTIYDFNNTVCLSYFTIVNSLRARQGLATAFLLPQSQSIAISSFQGLFEDVTTYIDSLPNLINQNIGKVESTSIYNKQIFIDYLIGVYSGNACDTMQNYTQYQNGDFLYDQCNSVAKGSLKQGLLNGIIFYINLYKDFTSFIYSYNAAAFQQNFNNFNSNTPAMKQFQFKIELSKAHEYLLNFFQDQNLQLYNYYQKLLDIFPQQVLIQNTYIMSYLRQNE
ncbi:transmembrane protein, putative (macronuclear) [Tetrahymena thermophila SB210]|uniref:Transmembrane protein, putative n=1 Tax=Tetrahymena thermophila (strain SB210) TaxID=312017 RepID=Q231Z1_TETTS|nr:transmembrane protein, putative [Tetrahymena thermophila SB210]EAR91309.2 transmembrane protein, putative [Tetrahymena thermophila SB210]|eukprot:XP_001011554.2 transmembrane protein, putative [Tetrahymena thermophila SB210]